MPLKLHLYHGVISDDENMRPFKDSLTASLGKVPVAQASVVTRTYVWSSPVLETAITEAEDICERDRTTDDLVLVGHSQGGLLCRLIAACICQPEGVRLGLSEEKVCALSKSNGLQSRLLNLEEHANRKAVTERLLGVVTIASPNNGALTFGQLSMLGRMLSKAGRFVASGLGQANWTDLATDRLFRILQYVNIDTVRYLSVSASGVNRFSPLKHGDLSLLPIVDRLGMHLDLPNDGVVEESSANLANATWKTEVKDVTVQHEHVSWYLGCGAATHTSVHSRQEVATLIAARIGLWLDSAPGKSRAQPPPKGPLHTGSRSKSA
jgi:hypothetical protein